MNDNRPRNVDFSTINLPLPAITSLLHRVSGGFIFIGVAVLLYLLDQSLSSQAGFDSVLALLDNMFVKLVVWAVLSGLLYHLIAGIKHLVMDMGIGETMQGALLGARLVILFSAISIVIAGVWIW